MTRGGAREGAGKPLGWRKDEADKKDSATIRIGGRALELLDKHLDWAEKETGRRPKSRGIAEYAIENWLSLSHELLDEIGGEAAARELSVAHFLDLAVREFVKNNPQI